MRSFTRYPIETRPVLRLILRKSRTPFRGGEQRGITRSVAIRGGVRLFTDKMRTVRRVINASPDPTGLTCSFRNGIRDGNGRLAPRRCLTGKTTWSAKGMRDLCSHSRASPAKRKALCVTRALLAAARSYPRPWRRVFFSPTRRDRYPRLCYKYTCNSPSSPTPCSHRTPIYLPIRRSCVYLYVRRDNARSRVFVVPLASRT